MLSVINAADSKMLNKMEADRAKREREAGLQMVVYQGGPEVDIAEQEYLRREAMQVVLFQNRDVEPIDKKWVAAAKQATKDAKIERAELRAIVHLNNRLNEEDKQLDVARQAKKAVQEAADAARQVIEAAEYAQDLKMTNIVSAAAIFAGGLFTILANPSAFTSNSPVSGLPVEIVKSLGMVAVGAAFATQLFEGVKACQFLEKGNLKSLLMSSASIATVASALCTNLELEPKLAIAASISGAILGCIASELKNANMNYIGG